jgi:hypothetical protein
MNVLDGSERYYETQRELKTWMKNRVRKSKLDERDDFESSGSRLALDLLEIEKLSVTPTE